MIFPSADDARANARNNIIIFNEVRNIENEILTAISQNLLSIKIVDTTMTNPGTTLNGTVTPGTGYPYYQAWSGIVPSRELSDQMDQVVLYFTDIGYSVSRFVNTDTNYAFYWEIMW